MKLQDFSHDYEKKRLNKTALFRRLDVDKKTIFNWENTKTKLINLIYSGIAIEEHFQKTKEFLTNQKNLLNFPEKRMNF